METILLNEQVVTNGSSVLLNYGPLGVIALAFLFGLYWVMTNSQKDKDKLIELLGSKDKNYQEKLENMNTKYAEVIENNNKAWMENAFATKELIIVLKNNYDRPNKG